HSRFEAVHRRYVSTDDTMETPALTQCCNFQAAAYVSGLVASLISSEGNISPADMKAKLKGLAIQDAIANIPIGTPNLLAQNGLAPQ
ncbi:hypothetical protein H0H93_015154, partial [Arthromyces matolae]